MTEDDPNRPNGDSWDSCTILTLKKNQSLDGISANHHHLLPLMLCTLPEVDMIQFGTFSSSLMRLKKITEKVPEENEIEQRLADQNIAYEMILMGREEEQAILVKKIIQQTKESKADQQKAFQAKDVLSNIVELMDAKLQCSMCREYLVKATGLNCSHVFCKLCLEKWMKVKKECPNCRSPVTAHIQIPALDYCIENMIDQLGDEIREQRTVLLKQRKTEQDEFEHSKYSLFNVLNAFMSGRYREAEVAETFRRIASHTKSFVRTGAAHTKSFVRTGTAALRRTVLNTKELARVQLQIFTTSAVFRRAVALAQATVRTGAEELTKSAVLRRAAALTRAVALTGAEAFTKSKFLEKAAALAKATTLKGSQYVKRSQAIRRAAEVTRKLVEEIPKHPTVRKAMMFTRAAITKGAFVKRAYIVKLIKDIKIKAIRKAAEAKKLAIRLRSLAATRLAGLTGEVVHPRTRANITTNAKTAISTRKDRNAHDADDAAILLGRWNVFHTPQDGPRVSLAL